MVSRLLVLVDHTDRTGPALAYAAGLAHRPGSIVYALHVNPYLVGGRGHTDLSDRESAGLVESAVAELEGMGVASAGIRRRATVFDVPLVVADTLRATDAEAVVVPSQERTRWAGWLHRFARSERGLAARLAEVSPVPVLTAPGPLHPPADLSPDLGSVEPVRL